MKAIGTKGGAKVFQERGSEYMASLGRKGGVMGRGKTRGKYKTKSKHPVPEKVKVELIKWKRPVEAKPSLKPDKPYCPTCGRVLGAQEKTATV